jgi:teichuronic acid biosynthesis glycosyltransferase TuaC
MGPLRVLFVSNYLEARRDKPYAGIFVERQIESVRAAGVTVEYFDIGISLAPAALFRSWRRLRKVVTRWRPHVVHAQYGAAVGLLAAFSGAKTFVTFSGTDLHRGGGSVSSFRKVLGTAASQLAAMRAARVICVSAELRRHLIFASRKAEVIPRGVDLDLFSPGSREEARRALGWPEVPIALFVGGRDPGNKGQALAEEAVVAARSRVPELQLKILRDLMPAEMPLAYRAADLLLFTSLQEGSPNTVKEALACNLPVVTVSVGDVEERLAGVTPSAVVPRDPESLAAAMSEIIMEGRRSNGRAAVTELSLQAVARRLIALYEREIAP